MQQNREISPIKFMMIAIIISVIAIWAAMYAIASSAKSSAPLSVINLPIANGIANSNAALSYIATANKQQNGQGAQQAGQQIDSAELEIPKQAYQQALLGWKREPLADSSLTALALYYGRNKQSARTAKLMDAVLNITRRNEIASLWLMENYAKKNNTPGVIRMIDVTLNTEPDLRNNLLPLLAQGLASKDAIEEYYNLLKTEPKWIRNFWYAATANRPSLPYLVTLRTRLLAEGKANKGRAENTQFDDVDRYFLNRLIANGLYESGFEYYDELIKLSGEKPSKSYIRNGSFSALSVAPPFDWELSNESGLGAIILAKQNQLELSTLTLTSGVAARQLLKLPKGSYQFEVNYESETPVSDKILRIRLQCAGDTSRDSIFFDVDREKFSKNFIHNRECDYIFLAIELDPGYNNRSVTLYLSDMAITRLTDAQMDRLKKSGQVEQSEQAGQADTADQNRQIGGLSGGL